MFEGYYTTKGLKYGDFIEWTVGKTKCARVPIDKLTKIPDEEAEGMPIFNIHKILTYYRAVSLSRAIWDHVIKIDPQ